MQVASRLLLVWGIMAVFGGDIVGAEKTQLGDYAYLGCVTAWGITEIIRYGFFAITLSGNQVPAWWTWLRYNTFYVLYPVGISSECALVYLALGPAGEIEPLLKWFLIAVLAVYVPGKSLMHFLCHCGWILLMDDSTRLLRSLHPHDRAAPQGPSGQEAC
jgi:very-long-chain (3R)-3-hydroxyacyl-CoA dehydratase